MITAYLVDFFGVLKYANDSDSEWNEELLSFFKKSDKELYVFTSSSVHENEEVQQKLNPIFKDIFSCIELGINKKEVYAYEVIARKIGKQPSEILFIDDTPSNVEAAKEAGVNTVVYTSFEDFKKNIINLTLSLPN